MQEKEKYQMIQDKISGCVFAGALGDALGYVVEFDLYSSIKNKYGKDGIQDLLRTGEEAIISDDTQMTLFTMEGMSVETEDEVEEKIYLSYLKWAQTQGMSVKLPCDWPSRLAVVPKMNCRRAPGNTCLYALTSGKMGTIQEQQRLWRRYADCTAWIHRRLRFTSFEWCQSGSHNSRSSAWLDSGRHAFGYCFQMYLWRKEAVETHHRGISG